MRQVLVVCAVLAASGAGAADIRGANIRGVIESFAGSVNLSVSGSVMPLPDPRASLTESMLYDITRRHEVSVPGGGSAAVAYRAIDTPAPYGALLDICAWTNLNLNVPPPENSSTARVDLTFTTTRDLAFTITATAQNSYYEAAFDSFIASMFPDPSVPGGVGGTIGLDGTITFSGILAAGAHTLAIFTTPAGPRGPAESNYGQFTLTLSEDTGDVHMNPTPSAAVGGLALLGGVLLRRRPRRAGFILPKWRGNSAHCSTASAVLAA